MDYKINLTPCSQIKPFIVIVNIKSKYLCSSRSRYVCTCMQFKLNVISHCDLPVIGKGYYVEVESDSQLDMVIYTAIRSYRQADRRMYHIHTQSYSLMSCSHYPLK